MAALLTKRTIGHTTRTLEVFLDLLRACGAERVIDVRGSTRKPCAKSDAGQGSATYIYGSWEALRHARRDSINMGWRHMSFRGFADYMQTSEFNPGLQRLIQLAHQKRNALPVAEAVSGGVIARSSRMR
jgi:hypothetical protein